MHRFDSPHRAQVCLTLASMALSLSVATNLAAADARETLSMSGLTEVGRLWICRQELELRRQLARIDRLKSEYKKARDVVDGMIAANQTLGKSLQQAERRSAATLRLIKAATSNPAERRRLDAVAKANKKIALGLKRQFLDSNQFGAHPAVRRHVIRLINARNRLTLAVFSIRRESATIATVYPPLQARVDIRQALADLGGAHRLGPARDYRADLARVAKIDSIINSAQVAVFRQDDHFRIPVIVNGRYPTILSAGHSTGPTVVPLSLLRAAGIRIADNAPRAVYQASRTRQLQVRRITIGSLRIGPAVYHNIEAFVLPPEGEDLGARLGKEAYVQRPFEIDGLKLCLTVDPPPQ